MLLVIARQAMSGQVQDETANLITAARSFVELLVNKDFPAAVATFDDTMKTAMPEAKLQETWTAVLAQVGAFKQAVKTGERDYQVTMEDFKIWSTALATKSNVTLKSYPSLNHLFIAGTGRSTPSEYEQAGHVDERVVEDIAAWIKQR